MAVRISRLARWAWVTRHGVQVVPGDECRPGAILIAAMRREPSQEGKSTTQIGSKWIDITYGRPIKRGRDAPKIVGCLSADPRAAYPETTGFSRPVRAGVSPGSRLTCLSVAPERL